MADDKITAEQYEAMAKESAKLAMQIAEAKRKRDELMSQTGCKKPVIMLGQKKKDYLKCLEGYKARVEAAKEADRALVRMQIELKRLEALQGKGLSTTMKWVIGGSIAAVLITTGIIIVVKMNKN